MPMTGSSREFNQDNGEAKKAALEGPVFLTNHGRPAHVWLSIEVDQRLAVDSAEIGDLLAMPDADLDGDFEAPPWRPEWKSVECE
ncbi:MAG: hypothetical protein JOY84_08265 [Curvibacter sp.]|nr:hypothetical protein [Curvibacter sp.]